MGKKNKKGQAAMEFLMTYGWAILVVLAAIGALAYFGVLSPKNLLPSSCTVGAGFGCTNAKATATTYTMTVRQNLGEDLDYFNLTLTGDAATCTTPTNVPGPWTEDRVGTTPTFTGLSYNYTGLGTPIRTGKEVGTFAATACSFSGTSSVDLTIDYRKTGETVWHSATGKANLKVETS